MSQDVKKYVFPKILLDIESYMASCNASKDRIEENFDVGQLDEWIDPHTHSDVLLFALSIMQNLFHPEKYKDSRFNTLQCHFLRKTFDPSSRYDQNSFNYNVKMPKSYNFLDLLLSPHCLVSYCASQVIESMLKLYPWFLETTMAHKMLNNWFDICTERGFLDNEKLFLCNVLSVFSRLLKYRRHESHPERSLFNTYSPKIHYEMDTLCAEFLIPLIPKFFHDTFLLKSSNVPFIVVVQYQLLCLYSDLVKHVHRILLPQQGSTMLWQILLTLIHQCENSIVHLSNLPMHIQLKFLDFLLVLETSTRSCNDDENVAVVFNFLIRFLKNTSQKVKLDQELDDGMCFIRNASCDLDFPLIGVRQWFLLFIKVLFYFLSKPPSLKLLKILDELNGIFTTTTMNKHQVNLVARFCHVFADQDDKFIELLHMTLRMHILYKTFNVHIRTEGFFEDNPTNKESLTLKTDFYKNIEVPFILRELDPHSMFNYFLKLLDYDHAVVLDMLISTETMILEYLLTYLTYLQQEWTSYVTHFSLEERDCIESTLIRLELAISRFHSKGLFPYNPMALLRRLRAIEALHHIEE